MFKCRTVIMLSIINNFCFNFLLDTCYTVNMSKENKVMFTEFFSQKYKVHLIKSSNQ